jgi:hypothetical protein
MFEVQIWCKLKIVYEFEKDLRIKKVLYFLTGHGPFFLLNRKTGLAGQPQPHPPQLARLACLASRVAQLGPSGAHPPYRIWPNLLEAKTEPRFEFRPE